MSSGEPPCVGKVKELIAKKKVEFKCLCSKTRMAFNAKHIVSCCRKVSSEFKARHDTVLNILPNKILV